MKTPLPLEEAVELVALNEDCDAATEASLKGLVSIGLLASVYRITPRAFARRVIAFRGRHLDSIIQARQTKKYLDSLVDKPAGQQPWEVQP